MSLDPERWLPPNGPLFHVRFIENGVEQEQIFVGVPDGAGNFNINVPTPCTLLSVKQHGFPWCEVCDSANSITPKDREVFARFLDRQPMPDRASLIRAEVAAMDWPEVIGESEG
jgi:hypothetical protein